MGKSGKAVNVTTNYFNLLKRPSWRLYKYRVDMVPEVDYIKTRKWLLSQHKEILPQMMFDGTLMFVVDRLDSDPTVLNTTTREGQVVKITLRLVEELKPTDFHYMQFFNIVLRKVMDGLGLVQVRRDFFDPAAKKDLKQYKLEVWPGYVTSIRQHEEKILLCCEVGNKVLRTDTVLDQITEVHKRTGNNTSVFRSSVEKALLGCIVITRYNNKTYRIDQIDWDKNPRTEFEGRKGESLSLVQYYADKYGKTLRDLQQPLIISVPPLREQRAGNTGPLYLVPELCNMTGLSEEQRANFKLMTDLGRITRQGPAERSQTLAKFSNRLNSNAAIKEELNSWNLAFAKELVQVT